MPIKTLVSVLAVASLMSFLAAKPSGASSEAAYMRTITTNPDFGLRIAKFRVMTTGAVTSAPGSIRPRDMFRAIINGIQLQDGDAVSFSFEGPDGRVDLGSPTFTGPNASLTLFRRKGRGILGVPPHEFTRSRVIFNHRRKRVLLLATRGTAQATPVITTLAGGRPTIAENIPINITIHIRRTTEADTSFTVPGRFRVRHSMRRRTQTHIYKGIAR